MVDKLGFVDLSVRSCYITNQRELMVDIIKAPFGALIDWKAKYNYGVYPYTSSTRCSCFAHLLFGFDQE